MSTLSFDTGSETLIASSNGVKSLVTLLVESDGTRGGLSPLPLSLFRPIGCCQAHNMGAEEEHSCLKLCHASVELYTTHNCKYNFNP